MKSLLLIMALCLSVYGNQDREKRVPPKEAISVCENKSEGSSCSVEGKRGTMTGSCRTTPDNKYFACIPDRRPNKNRR